MSYASLARASVDPDLNARTNAAANQEARVNSALTGTDFARAVVEGQVGPVSYFAWPVALNCEADYEAGGAGNVSDAAIGAAVQAAWPPDPWPPVA